MPKVFLFGYYGFGNLGDELLCAYYTQIFRQYFPGFELVVLTGNKHQSAQDGEAPYTVANRWNLWRLGRMMAPGIFWWGRREYLSGCNQQAESPLLSVAFAYGPPARVAIILTGQGIGPLSSWGRKAARPVLNLAETIGCRDQNSLMTLAEMEVNIPQLYLGVDPLWDYPFPTAWSSMAPRKKRTPVVGYIFRAGRGRKKKELLLTLNSLFGNLQLIPLSPADEQAAYQLADELKLIPPWCIREPAEFFTVAAELSVVLSERLHGLLLAARYRLPGLVWARIRNSTPSAAKWAGPVGRGRILPCYWGSAR